MRIGLFPINFRITYPDPEVEICRTASSAGDRDAVIKPHAL
jgi:hypothetical protein